MRLRRGIGLIALSAAACVVPAASAPAATVSLDVTSDGELAFGTLEYRAAPGEVNAVTVARASSGWVVRDRRNPLRVRGDCERVSRHVAHCPSTESAPRLWLGDGDDRAVVDSAAVSGDAGDDVLLGAGHADRLYGGPGQDALSGRGGDDVLVGGRGRDRVLGGGDNDLLVDGETNAQAQPDRLDGGSSTPATDPETGDVVSYAARTRGVTIDLARGRASTRDTLVNVEGVTGGRGADRLTGDTRDNQLSGGPGDDVLRGAGGRDVALGGPGDDQITGERGGDVLWGDAGADALTGGSGDDLLISREERGGFAGDSLSCGDGEDSARSERRDTLASGCEWAMVYYNALLVAAAPVLRGDVAEFALRCPLGGCPGGAITLRTLDRPRSASAGFGALERDERTVAVPLDAAMASDLRDGAEVGSPGTELEFAL